MRTAARSNRTQTLQRKCGCGDSCGSCREKRELRRSAIDPRTPESVPASVEGVLRSPGEPLDASLRQTLEPRFGHDFSSVRVHTGADAAGATKDVHARAWTVGNHIAFGAGQSPRDLRLLAHELTHVLQQSGTPQTSSLSVGGASDPAEAEADAAASAVMRGHRVPIAARNDSVLRRWIPGGWVEVVREWARLHPAGREMTKDEITTAEKVTGGKAPSTGAPGAGKEPLFVLHDTASLVSDKRIDEQKDMSGPQGKGVQAWLPQRRKVKTKDPSTRKTTTTIVTPDPVITRQPFYEEKRPSATAYERGQDIIGLSAREVVFRAAWKATSTTEQDAALDRALAGTGLDATEETTIRAAAKTHLKGGTTKVDGAATTATWAIEEICARVQSAGAAAVAAPDKPRAKTKNADTLTANCATVQPLFTTRNERIASIVGVEIVQPKNSAAMPNPPYTPKQYDDLAKLYIRAALEARRWPKIISHRELDKIIKGGHGDPRCFNLNEMYRLIASHMGHDAATIYGMEPKYGKDGTPGVNIAWTKKMCHGDPPK